MGFGFCTCSWVISSFRKKTLEIGVLVLALLCLFPAMWLHLRSQVKQRSYSLLCQPDKVVLSFSQVDVKGSLKFRREVLLYPSLSHCSIIMSTQPAPCLEYTALPSCVLEGHFPFKSMFKSYHLLELLCGCSTSSEVFFSLKAFTDHRII